jgi:hypothetical protein
MAQIIRIPVSEKEKVSSLTMPARENVKHTGLCLHLEPSLLYFLKSLYCIIQLETMPI